MAQDKAVNSTTEDNIQDSKGIKVSKAKIKSLKGRLKGSNKPETRGRKPISNQIDLDKLEEYASQPINNKEIAEALNISVTTFYREMKRNPEFKNAYEAGIENRKYELEKALYKRATGFEGQEIETVKDGEGNIVKQKITDKTYVPDTAAAIFALKNVYSDKYKEVVQTQTDININVNQIHQLSDSELAKIASASIVEAIDYNIE